MDGSDLKLVRGVLGITRVEMGERVGMSSSHVAHLEAGDRDITLRTHREVLRLMRSEEFHRQYNRIAALRGELERMQACGDFDRLGGKA